MNPFCLNLGWKIGEESVEFGPADREMVGWPVIRGRCGQN